MSSRFDIMKWREIMEPDTCPYRPGARHTQGFGLRHTDIGSPFHLGGDRGKDPREILSPFYGSMVWKMLPEGKAAGSILQLIPDTGHGDIELQVFHTVPAGEVESRNAESIERRVTRGERLPVIAGELGLSAGIHTHTEAVARYSDELIETLEHVDRGVITLYDGVSFDWKWIKKHCRRHGLSFRKVRKGLEEQVDTWGISYMSDRYAIRRSIVFARGGYREPHWRKKDGEKTVHISPRWLLKI